MKPEAVATRLAARVFKLERKLADAAKRYDDAHAVLREKVDRIIELEGYLRDIQAALDYSGHFGNTARVVQGRLGQ